eukprot:8363660-Pyramimonas_sp.AAC.1
MRLPEITEGPRKHNAEKGPTRLQATPRRVQPLNVHSRFASCRHPALSSNTAVIGDHSTLNDRPVQRETILKAAGPSPATSPWSNGRRGANMPSTEAEAGPTWAFPETLSQGNPGS